MRCQLKDARIVALVVTYERRTLLAEALAAVEGQTRPPDAVVVVDNASTDGTAALVRDRFPRADLLELPRNTGGAGGFAAGIAHALELGADAIWLMDDDTLPRPDALAALLAARGRAAVAGGPAATRGVLSPTGPRRPRVRARRPAPAGPPALVASRVTWTDGRDHPMNTPRTRPSPVPGCARIRSASFVSVLLDAGAVRACGPPIADYFLWNDDFEYTLRLLRGRVGLLCRDSVVVHRTAAPVFDPGARFFYEARNKVWLFTRSRCLAPGERLVYAGSTLLRWARALAGSPDRAGQARALGRGLWAGLRSGPRPNEQVIPYTGSAPR